jgi:hypothetical protein
MLRSYHNNTKDHIRKPTNEGVIASEVNYVVRQLEECSLFLLLM